MNKKLFCRVLILAASVFSNSCMGSENNNENTTTSDTQKVPTINSSGIALSYYNGGLLLTVPIEVLREKNYAALQEFEKYPITTVKVVLGTGKNRHLCLSGNDLKTLARYFPNITGLNLSSTRIRMLLRDIDGLFPRLISLLLSNNNRLKPSLGSIVYTNLARRLTHLDISFTSINLSDGQLKEFFPNARIVRYQDPAQRDTSITVSTTTLPNTIQPNIAPQQDNGLCLEAPEDKQNKSGVEKPKKKRRLKMHVVSHSAYPIKNVSTTISSTSKKDELITVLRSYLNEYQDIMRSDVHGIADFATTHRLILLRTVRLGALERLLTDYRNSGHILDSLLSSTMGLAHTIIEYENPELLQLIIALEPEIATSTHYTNGYNPLELLLQKYVNEKDDNKVKIGLRLLTILLEGIQKNKTITLQNVLTARAVRNVLQHGPVGFIRVLVRALVSIAYNDDEFKSKLILMSGRETYTFEQIRQELMSYIAEYADIPLSPENQELIRNELQTIINPDYLNAQEQQTLLCLYGRSGGSIDAQIVNLESLNRFSLSLTTSFEMIRRWLFE